jgi:hypothetical protein
MHARKQRPEGPHRRQTTPESLQDYPTRTIQMEEELCLVDSCTTNTILRELKYFQTLKRVKEMSQLSQDAVL